jgi:hypothetical protein
MIRKKYRKTVICLIMMLFANELFVFANSSLMTNIPQNRRELTKAEYENIKNETMRIVKELSHYIKVLTDKSIVNKEIHNQAVTDAVRLFQSEDKIVQVSNLKTNSKNDLKVRAYFNKIRILPYRKIEIEWYHVEYVSDLRKGADNKYYGIVTVFQDFKGYSGDGVAYKDKTQKNIEIIVDIKEDPFGNINWKVYLGNISVVETKETN